MNRAALGVLAGIRKKLASKEFFRNVLLLAGGTAVAQVVPVTVMPLLTRLYTPSQFGLLQVFSSILSILIVVASLRYEQAILIPGDDETALDLLALSGGIAVGISAIFSLVLVVIGDDLAVWVGAPELSEYLWLLPVALLAAGVYQALSYWALRVKAFSMVARTKIVQNVGRAVTQAIMGVLPGGVLGLLLGDVVGRFGGTGPLIGLVFREQDKIGDLSFKRLKEVARRFRRFPLLSSWAALLNSIGGQVPGLLLAASYGPEVLGVYALTQRVMGLPLDLIGNAVGQVYRSEVAFLVRTDPGRISRLFLKTLLLTAAIGAPIVLLVAIVPTNFYLFLFGSEWGQVGAYLRILSIMFLTRFAVNATEGALDVLERQDLHLVRELFRVVLTVGTVSLAPALGLDAKSAVMLLGVASTVGYLIYGIMSWSSIRKFCQRLKDDQAHFLSQTD